MSGNTKKVAIIPTAITAALVLMASTTLMSGTAFAQQGLHFTSDPTATVRGNTLIVTGEVAGAGRTATATLTGTAEVTQGCVNKGGNEPRGLQTTTEDILVTEPFNTRQGRGSFTLDFTATGDPNFSCPSPNMRATVVDVSFTGLVLTVTSQTGTIVTQLPDQ